jgi:hypothetical protein
MVRGFLLAAFVWVAVAAGAVPALAADPQSFKSEDSATKFCKSGNVVWFNPDSKIYFEPGTRYYGKTKQGGFTCRGFADKSGYRGSK